MRLYTGLVAKFVICNRRGWYGWISVCWCM